MGHEGRRNVPLNPFSPWRSTAESLQQTIVGRDHIIKDLLGKTKRFCSGSPAKHCLLVGRRGLGKTHILSLLYHYYRNHLALPGFKTLSRRLMPVIFLEEERHSLHSLAVFLMKTFEKFFEKMPDEIRWQVPEYLEDDEDVCEYCFDNLKTITQSTGKKIIILCDNLEDIFNQWRDREFKRLRSFLSDQRAVMLIGTAVKIFNEVINPKEPFYEFFEFVPLPDLSDDQMLEVLKNRFFQDNLEEEYFRKQKNLKNKMGAIAKLTGGNPRLVVFLYDIVTKKNVFEIESATEELMESLNEYFRNRFTLLAPQERTLLDAFAEMDGPATPKEIAKKTRIKESSTHAHIKKLKQAGFIDTVEFGKHKFTRYDVTERLFRLWRQTATISGRKKFQILIKFLKLYFTPEELKADFKRSVRQLDSALLHKWTKGMDEYLHYLTYLQQAADGSLKYEIFDTRTDFLLKKGDYDKAEKEIASFKNDIESGKEGFDLAPLYRKLAKTHLYQGKYEEADKDIAQYIGYPVGGEEEEYKEVLDRISGERPTEAQACYYKGILLGRTGHHEKALEYFSKAVELKPKEPDYCLAKAVALGNLNRPEEAARMIEKAFSLDKDNSLHLRFKSMFLILTCQFEEALPFAEKLSKIDPNDVGAKMSFVINRACVGDFGDNMEGLPTKIAKENLEAYQAEDVTRFIYRIMERCLDEGKSQVVNGLYLTLLKLKGWHTIDEVQNRIGLYIRQLIERQDRKLFIDAVNAAIEHVTDESLLGFLNAFIYAARYLQDGNKIILEEVFPEIRDIILEIIEKLGGQHSPRPD